MLLRHTRIAALIVALVILTPVVSIVFAADAPAPVQVHGYMQNRIYLAPGANAQFKVERVSVSALATLPSETSAYVELYYHPWTSSNGLYLESAFYESPLETGKIRVGKGRRMTFGMTPAYPNRKTSNYGVVAEAMTQDRIQGIQYMVQKGVLDAGISMHTAYRLGTRSLGDVPGDDVRNNSTATTVGHVVPHLCLRDPHSGGGNATQTPNQLSGKMQFAGRLGGKWDNGIKAGISASASRLDPRDLANLQGTGVDNVLRPRNPLTGTAVTTAIGPGFSNKNMSQFGLDIQYKHPKGFVAQTEFYSSKLSTLKYNAWDVLVGYEPPTGWKFYARYGTQNMDITPTDNPLTWDTRQISLSAVQPLRKGLWLQYEYEINMENTDTGQDVSNNVFFVELFSGF